MRCHHVTNVLSLNLADIELIFRRISTLSDDRLDGFNRFGCHVPGHQGLELAGNSLSVGTNVES